MATEFRDRPVYAEEGTPVRSRISWGAIFAGVVVAFAVYILLNLLGLAVGLSVGDDPGRVGTGTAIWAIIASLVALFLGGWVVTQCTSGENRMEAVFYGVVLWGVLFAGLLWLAGVGVRMGLGALVAMGGDEQVVAFRPADVAEDAAATEERREDFAAGAWWAFFGVLLSMVAAVAGTLVGSSTPSVFHRGRTVTPTGTTYQHPPGGTAPPPGRPTV
jgi:hypothetical protein